MAISTIEEGTQFVKSTEAIIFTLDVSRIGLPSDVVTDPTMTVIRRKDGVDVTDEVLTGSMSVDDQMITLKRISKLEKLKSYRVHVGYTKGGNDLETFFVIRCPSR